MALQQILSLIDSTKYHQGRLRPGNLPSSKKAFASSLQDQYPNELRNPGRHPQRSGPRRRCCRRRHRSQLPRLPLHGLLRTQHLPRPQLLGRPRLRLPGRPRSAKVGLPHKQVVVITGDGGFQYNIQELGTALQYGINPVVLVFNDNAWGVLKGVQRETFNGRYMGTELRNPDFVKLAEAYGAAATRVHNLDQLTKALGSALEGDVVHLIVVEMPKDFASFR